MDDAEGRQSWQDSARAWIEFSARDKNRTLLLDPVMLEFAGDVNGLDVLDDGCGEGRFCRMLSERGARTTGIDPTEPLIAEAKARHPESAYLIAVAEDLPFADSSFDLVVSYLVLIDVEEYKGAIQEMARVVRPGGKVLVANLNPFATTTATGWVRDLNGVKLHFPVDDYLRERPLRSEWANLSIINWHRSMQAYMTAFLETGLILRKFVEPVPSEEVIRQDPSMAESLRFPFFHVMVWERLQLPPSPTP